MTDRMMQKLYERMNRPKPLAVACPGCGSRDALRVHPRSLRVSCAECHGTWAPQSMQAHMEKVTAAEKQAEMDRVAQQERAARFATRPTNAYERQLARQETADRLRQLMGGRVPPQFEVSTRDRVATRAELEARANAKKPAEKSADETERDRRYEQLRQRAGLGAAGLVYGGSK